MWYQKSAEETAFYFQTDPKRGLTAREHEKRLKENGLNVLKEKKKISPAGIFFRQFGDFMVMVLMLAAVVSAVMGERADALMIAAIIFLNSILGFVQEYNAERSLESLRKLNEDEARVLFEGELRVIPAAELVVGDVVVVEQGTKVPADLRLTEAFDLRADESILTGESEHRSKHTDALAGEVPLGQRSNMCFSGTVILGGRGLGIVTDVGMGTELGQIAKMLDAGERELTPLQKQLKRLGKVLIILCAAICSLVAFAGILIGGDLYTMILTGVSLGVASIPEGLPVIVTVCLALGVRRLAAVHAIVRRLPTVETLGCVNCICTDKTGTLTKNRMETVYYYGEGEWHGLCDFGKKEKLAADTNFVLTHCHSLYRDGDTYYGDPTEVALVEGAKRNGAPAAKGKIIHERSFDSERKMMSVLCEYNGCCYSLVKGAPDKILARCAKIRSRGTDIPLGYGEKNEVLNAARTYGRKGCRVLAVAWKRGAAGAEDMEEDLTFLALAALRDPLREDAPDSLQKALDAGIRSIMITGDQRGTAFAIAKDLGIAENEADVLTGEEMAALSDGDLWARLKKASVAAAVSPADKMRIVSVLRKNGVVCAMTGDGVNDAPALKEADVGIAMGKKGTDVTKEAADLVLADDRFSTIVDAVFLGRGIYDNIRRSLRYLLSSNLGEILVMLISVLLCFPLPLLPMQILWINLVTDGLPAMALAMGSPRPDLMRERPRDASQSILGGGLGRKILSRGIFIGVISFASFFAGIWLSEDIGTARTMAFNTLILAQLFYVFDCRGKGGGKGTLFGELFLPLSLLFSFFLQGLVIYHPFFNEWFYTVPLCMENLLLSVAFAGLPSVFFRAFYAVFSKKYEKNYKKRRK